MRADGGQIKTDEERRQMAQKKRFKANREFKKAIDEDDDQSGFRFKRENQGGKGGRFRGEERGFDRGNGKKSYRGGGKSFDKGNKSFNKNRKYDRYEED